MLENYNSAWTQTNKGGRPKKDAASKKVHFNIMLTPETLERLRKAAAKIQLQTGKRETASGIICQAIDEFLEKCQLVGQEQ